MTKKTKSSRQNPKIRSRAGTGGLLHGGFPLPYDAASTWGRGQDMPAFRIGGNSALIQGGNVLRARSRDLYRQNAQAYGSIESYVAEAIGCGIKVIPASPDKVFNKELKDVLETHIYPNIDADGVTDFYGLQRRVKTSQLVGGDVVLLHIWHPDGTYKVRGLPSEFLPYEDNRVLENGNRVIAGVEIDAITKEKVAYHLLREHPDEAFTTGGGYTPGTSVRVPVKHASLVYWPSEFGVLRGEPILTRAIIPLYELDMYRDGELRRKNQVGKTGLILKRSAKSGRSIADMLEEDQEETGVNADYDTTEDLGNIVFEPGTSLAIENDEEATVVQTPDVGGNYVAFNDDQERMIAKSMGLLAQFVNNDWSRVQSDRVLKAGLAHQKRQIESTLWTQDIPQSVRIQYQNCVRSAILRGLIKVPRSMSESDIFKAVYVPQKTDHLHQKQEEEIKKLRLEMGLTTQARLAAEEGEDAEELDAERALELARHKKLGLQYERSRAPGFESPFGGSDDHGIVVDDGEANFDPHRSARRVKERNFGLKF